MEIVRVSVTLNADTVIHSFRFLLLATMSAVHTSEHDVQLVINIVQVIAVSNYNLTVKTLSITPVAVTDLMRYV